jgi:hypothetical protein
MEQAAVRTTLVWLNWLRSNSHIKQQHDMLSIGGTPLKMAKNFFPPINTKLSVLVDIRLIRMYTKFEGEKLIRSCLFYSVIMKILVCEGKLLVGECSVENSACQVMLRHALTFKYYLIMSKEVLLKFGQVTSIKTLPFIAKLTWAVLLAFAGIC